MGFVYLVFLPEARESGTAIACNNNGCIFSSCGNRGPEILSLYKGDSAVS